jgi:hypothetical protein
MLIFTLLKKKKITLRFSYEAIFHFKVSIHLLIVNANFYIIKKQTY